jgi:hypothetical protein
MMKIARSFSIDMDFLMELQKYCIEKGVNVSNFVEDAAREKLERDKKKK